MATVISRSDNDQFEVFYIYCEHGVSMKIKLAEPYLLLCERRSYFYASVVLWELSLYYHNVAVVRLVKSQTAQEKWHINCNTVSSWVARHIEIFPIRG